MKRTIAAAAIAAAFAFLAGFVIAQGHYSPYGRIMTTWYKVSPYKPDSVSQWKQTAEVYRQMPDDLKGVSLVGDSLVAYGDWHLLLPGIETHNRGIPGDTSAGVRQRVAGDQSLSPMVLVAIGVNDKDKGISLAQAKDNVRVAVASLKGHKILLQAPLPTSDSKLNKWLNGLAAYERDLCDSGACEFIDVTPALAANGVIRPQYTIDGVHVSWAGYQAWAAALKPRFKDLAV